MKYLNFLIINDVTTNDIIIHGYPASYKYHRYPDLTCFIGVNLRFHGSPTDILIILWYLNHTLMTYEYPDLSYDFIVNKIYLGYPL